MGQDTGLCGSSFSPYPLVNPPYALQAIPVPVYHLAMERNTPQRQAIRRVIEEAGRPLSPQEILKVAQVYTPRLGVERYN